MLLISSQGWKCNILQMNDDNTEAMLISSNRLSKFHPVPCSIQNDNSIQFSQHLRNLDILIDSSLSFHQQVNNICRAAYLELRYISMIRGDLSADATKIWCVPLCCPDLITVMQDHVAYLNVFCTNCKKFKIQQLMWYLRHQELITLHQSYINFTGFQFVTE